MGESRNARSLGAYVLTVAAMQVTLYAVMTPKSASWLFYFDPRIGVSFWQSALTRTESSPAFAAWVSVPALAVAGIRLLRQPESVRQYLWTEAVLALPSVLFFAMILIVHINPAHGFSVGELIIPVAVFVPFTVLPFSWAWRLRQNMSREAR